MEGLRELALFAGAGGGILGGKLLGWRTVCAVEIEDYPRRVLLQRQNDGILQAFPIWDDVTTFDGKPWRGIVDVVSGGFPCQDISTAGKGAGIDGERSGLWKEFARIIREVRPQYAFVENSPALTIRGISVVLGDLAEMGFDAKWGIVSALTAGAPHLRKRIWIVGHSCSEQNDQEWRIGQQRRNALGRGEQAAQQTYRKSNTNCIGRSGQILANSASARLEKRESLAEDNEQKLQTIVRSCNSTGKIPNTDDQARRNRQPGENGTGQRQTTSNTDSNGCDQGRKSVSEAGSDGLIGSDWWTVEPRLGRVANGVAYRVDRLKAIGNGQVPEVARIAWEILSGDNND